MKSINPQELWQATVGELELQMTRPTFNNLLRDSHCLGLEDGHRLVVSVKTGYAVEWLRNRFYPMIKRTLCHLAQQDDVEVRFIVWEGKPMRNEIPSPLFAQTDPRLSSSDLPDPGLNPDYTFDNFVVGPGNELAQAASLAVAESPAGAYNPLFIYGGVGLGKTHLLHAIGHLCYARRMHILYVSSETFTNDLIEAIRTQSTDRFRDKYRTADILLVDDIQFIAGKESTQEEFFHTFNALRDNGKQIVLSSDRPPKAMVTLEERLRSRFQWGLIVDIQPPDYEMRVAILRAKAQRLHVDVPNEVLNYIASHIESNIRELEGALNRVLATARLTGIPLTKEMAQQTLNDFLPSRPKLSADQIIETVASYYGLERADICGSRRSRRIALPRQIAMYLLRSEAHLSYPQIGAHLGGRDHTTVLYGCERIQTKLERDEQLRREVRSIKGLLYDQQN